MDVVDFSKYVVNNLNRATLGNALNITSTVISSKYNLDDFINNIIKYSIELGQQNKLNCNTVYNILFYSNKCLETLKNKGSLTDIMVLDNYIIEIWRAINGC